MTLDEAIKHAQWVADTNCDQCAEDHKQLAEWLKELKELRKLCWHPASELPPEEGEYIVISLPDMYGDTDVFYTEYRQPYGWCYEIEGHYAKVNIQKWCYAPKDTK